MDFAQRQLLCTFTTLAELESELTLIARTYKIDGDIYVLQNQDVSDEIYLTYNVRRDMTTPRRPKTISVHRKKDYNVIYSINALNLMAGGDFSGSLNPRHEIDWDRYRNSLVVVNGKSIVVFPTILLKIVRPVV